MNDVREVGKRYGEKVAVDDLTFQVRRGIVTGFLGPNGAGKSTLRRSCSSAATPERRAPTERPHPKRSP